ncbi:uncharacterized protein LOC120168896 [Hibiscus syriacus]|uniref:uncharacterized protein LOC120168896 n=1 Tax=Hibiscus syriacus TaxID=106335 RepID=UPI00192261CF|nr:uncharacterized protein LOC120168896 [Hibiscus syriacus]
MQGLIKTRTELPEMLVLEILSKLPVKSLTRFRVERPLGFWKNGELFLESSDQELVLFDPSIQELRNLGIYAYQETMHITTYVESLVPLNGRSEHEECIIRRPAGGETN